MAKFNELLLDTNFIIECGKRRILEKAMELVPGAKAVTLKPVVSELGTMNGKLGLELLETFPVEVLPADGYADDAIMEYASKGGVAVATNDKLLTEKLKRKGVAVVFPTKSGCGITGGVV